MSKIRRANLTISADRHPFVHELFCTHIQRVAMAKTLAAAEEWLAAKAQLVRGNGIVVPIPMAVAVPTAEPKAPNPAQPELAPELREQVDRDMAELFGS